MADVGQLIHIDRSSPVPLYFQVAQRLEQLIETGQLTPGSRLNNEITLADQLGLSRPTMRQAIRYLVDKGLLIRKRGVGTQVVHARVRRTVELTSLYDDLDRTHQQPHTQLLSLTHTTAPDNIALALALAPDTPILAIERLRYAHHQPLALMRNYLPTNLLTINPEDLTHHGLYQLLRAAGINLRLADQTISARRATTTEAKLLTEPRGAPLLTMSRTAYDDTGRAIEHGIHAYRPSLYSFEMTLVAR